MDFDERCKLEISREGDITTYELRMPWVDIYGDDGAVFAKRSVLFCILINDNDGSGRRDGSSFARVSAEQRMRRSL